LSFVVGRKPPVDSGKFKTKRPVPIITVLPQIKLWQHDAMARKKKKKRFQAVKAVKELARERVGTPPAEKVVQDKKKKLEKHKPTLGALLSESE